MIAGCRNAGYKQTNTTFVSRWNPLLWKLMETYRKKETIVIQITRHNKPKNEKKQKYEEPPKHAKVASVASRSWANSHHRTPQWRFVGPENPKEH